MSSQQQISGMALQIRNATENETFDLAGQNAVTIDKTVRDAFSQPLVVTEMLRITFVTGAGKLGRQKYDDGAARAVTSALRDLGYEEDRGASAVLECAGSFKQQHDTGKNLKTVVVFPKVTLSNAASAADGVDDGVAGLSLDGEGDSNESLLPSNSPEHKLAYSSMAVFTRNVPVKCQTWSQKKGCLAAIESVKATVAAVEEKLMKGTPLSAAEQNLYDAVSIQSLEEKHTAVRDLMHKQVETGQITASERATLLNQVSNRIETLTKEIDTAQQEKKPKRVENLTAARQKALERKEMLDKIQPKPPPKLRNENEIVKLRKEMIPLEKVEQDAKGRLLSVKESQAVSRKEEILEEIDDLEQSSRGWFESDDAFEARLQASRRAWDAKAKVLRSKKGGAGAAGKTTTAAATKWSTPASRKKPAAAAGKNAWGSKPGGSGKGGGGVFAAMMNDSDSD